MPANIVTSVNPHQILVSFPDWFCAILSLSILGLAFFLGKFYGKINEICKDYPTIRQALTKISEALTRISEILLQNNLTADLVYRQSPVKLTEAGITVIQGAGFESFYLKNKQLIIETINKSKPKSLADLDEACKKFMLNLNEDFPHFESIKQYAFNRGEPISRILFACAIALRDRLSDDLNIKT
jgi:hypothetical protein